MTETDQSHRTLGPSLAALMKEYRPSMSGDVLKAWAADVHVAITAEFAKSPSYDALLLIAQSVAGALTRAGVTDCDDPGEAIDVLREKWERSLAAGKVADRDAGGRVVREAWVNWALMQPNPKPSWLVPYDELSEPDKEADRQIFEAVARAVAPPADPAKANASSLDSADFAPVAWFDTFNACVYFDRAQAQAALDGGNHIIPVESVAKASGSAQVLRNLCDAAAKGFHTSESYGPGSNYLHVSKFKTLQDMQDYQRAWTDAMVSVRDATPPTSVPEVTEFPKKVTKTVCDGCQNLRTKRWNDHLDNDETDSGTEATCAQADRHISMYWHEGNATPAWCPLTAAMQQQEGKSHG